MNEKELVRVEKGFQQGNARNEEVEMEIDLLELFYKLLENAKRIIAVGLVGMLIFGVYSYIFATPMYEATAEIYVLSSSNSALNFSDLQIGSSLTKDYKEVFNTWEVKEMVRQNLGLNYSYSKIDSMMTITNPSDTRIIGVTITSKDPQEAMAMANEFADVASKYISDMMDMDRPNIFSKAVLPTKPVSPRKGRNMVMGFLLGAFLMAGIVVVQFLLDDKVKTADDIRKYTGMETLAVVPINGMSDRLYRDEKNGRKQRK